MQQSAKFVLISGSTLCSATKYEALHELECHHGVDLGQAYKSRENAKHITHYIAESQRKRFMDSLSAVNFYSFLMDGTTDAGRIEDKLIAVLHCIKDDSNELTDSVTRYKFLQRQTVVA